MGFIAFLSAIIYAVTELIGIITALHAILNTRTSQGAIAWAIVLVTFPWIGIPFYWVFGRNKFKGYVEALRAGNLRSKDLVGRAIKEMKKYSFEDIEEDKHTKITDNVFTNLSGMPFTSGNNIKLLKNGKETFDTIFEYIEGAKDYVLLEFFIVRDDETGKKLKKLLIKKAEQGVKIYFLYDEIGSRKLDESYYNPLMLKGVEIRPFFTTRGKRNRFQINFRNHRKIVVIDGKYGFVGGHNIGDEYLSKKKKYGFWRDTHILVEGPSVLGLQLTFSGDWFWAVRKFPDLNWRAHVNNCFGMKALPVPTDPGNTLDTCLLFFLNSIMRAKKRIWIASPYFVPDGAIIETLLLAALRGVDVKIILPGVADKKVAYLASFAYFKTLFVPGIKIYRYTPGFMHQKVLLIDDDMSAVGSANLDNRSFYLNFEMTMLIKDRSFAKEVEAMLLEDIAQSNLQIYPDRKMNSWFMRLAVRFASLFSPIL